MRSFVFMLFLTACTLCADAQTAADSISVCYAAEDRARYQLYPTTNMWTFLKLDTRLGRIWQVQWSFDKEKRFESRLSFFPAIFEEDGAYNGRFALYPTTNNYNFIMLDQHSGDTYQVQWSLDPDERAVLPITSSW